MPSPILQAHRQGAFLKKYLERDSKVLLGKFLGLQTHLGSMLIDVLVAISDAGIINRPKKISLEEVCKADQICDRVRLLIDKQQKESNVFNLNRTGRAFSKEEINKIVDFLLKQHKLLFNKIGTESKPNLITSPTEKKVVTEFSQSVVIQTPSIPKPIISKPNKAIAPPANKYSCRQCNKTNLFVACGKYGYYFKCLECNANTSINVVCQTCNSKEKIRKSGEVFYTECKTCNTSDLFYTDPAS